MPKNLKSETGKRPYSRPKLITYGELRVITAAKGGAKGDAGAPSTMA
jgi:hypothetical protein